MLAVAFVLTRLALKPLYEKIKTLNNFIKDATHEINTPLSIVLISTETMDKSSLNKRNLNRVNNINLAAKSLHNVYEDLLYLNFKPSMRKSVTIDFKTLLNERIEYFGIFFEKRALRVSKNLQNATIYANESELIRIIDNLLTNAVKYTNKGGNIDIRLTSNSLYIANSGEGMSKEQIAKIFDRYTRFNTDQGGFGIGLSVVKECCKNNDINIQCQSSPNSDTTFMLSWK